MTFLKGYAVVSAVLMIYLIICVKQDMMVVGSTYLPLMFLLWTLLAASAIIYFVKE